MSIYLIFIKWWKLMMTTRLKWLPFQFQFIHHINIISKLFILCLLKVIQLQWKALHYFPPGTHLTEKTCLHNYNTIYTIFTIYMTGNLIHGIINRFLLDENYKTTLIDNITLVWWGRKRFTRLMIPVLLEKHFYISNQYEFSKTNCYPILHLNI